MAAPPHAEGPAAPPPPPPPDDHQSELEDRPPFLTWRGIYLLVLGALALQVVVYTVLSKVVQ